MSFFRHRPGHNIGHSEDEMWNIKARAESSRRVLNSEKEKERRGACYHTENKRNACTFRKPHCGNCYRKRKHEGQPEECYRSIGIYIVDRKATQNAYTQIDNPPSYADIFKNFHTIPRCIHPTIRAHIQKLLQQQ